MIETPQATHHVFPNYASKDLGRVEPLARAIESMGYSVPKIAPAGTESSMTPASGAW